MALWIGHYLGKPREWFLVQARTKRDAAWSVDASNGEPDLRSMRRLPDDPNNLLVLNFRATFDNSGEGKYVGLRVRELWLDSEEIDGWMRRHLEALTKGNRRTGKRGHPSVTGGRTGRIGPAFLGHTA